MQDDRIRRFPTSFLRNVAHYKLLFPGQIEKQAPFRIKNSVCLGIGIHIMRADGGDFHSILQAFSILHRTQAHSLCPADLDCAPRHICRKVQPNRQFLCLVLPAANPDCFFAAMVWEHLVAARNYKSTNNFRRRARFAGVRAQQALNFTRQPRHMSGFVPEKFQQHKKKDILCF